MAATPRTATAYPHARRPTPRALAGISALVASLFFLRLANDRSGDAIEAAYAGLHSPKAKADVLHQALRMVPVQTQVVHRHGDRTPITPLEDEEFWASLLPTEDKIEEIGRRTRIVRRDDFVPHPAGGGAVYGRLTLDGMARMEGLGRRLRSEVLERLMPGRDLRELGDVDPRTWLGVASTDFSRTVQSVQMLLLGLLPEMPREGIEIDARQTIKMIPDPKPRRFVGQAERERELVSSSKFVAREGEMRPLAMRVTEILFDSKVLGDAAMKISFGVAEDEAALSAEKSTDLGNSSNDSTQHRRVLAWNQLAEILVCLENANRLPQDINLRMLRDVVEHNAWRWFALLRDKRLAAMAIKSLAKKMILNGVSALQTRVNNDSSVFSEPLLHVFSAHDATLISLLCLFDIERPEIWPEYGSYIKMELLRDNRGVLGTATTDASKVADKLYVLFSLNGEPLRSGFGDKDGGKKNYFVPWHNIERGLEDIERGLPPLTSPG